MVTLMEWSLNIMVVFNGVIQFKNAATIPAVEFFFYKKRCLECSLRFS
jgi:hypothetical protein